MIRAIIFDYGNVISRVDNNKFLASISGFCDKSVTELHKLIYEDSGLPVQYETGLITSDEFYHKISELCGLKIIRADFITAFTDIFTPIRETAGLIKQLKCNNYKLALLSNTNEWDFEHEIRNFDTVTLSFVVKEMKPGRKIYMDALGKLKLDPEECVYIDDIKGYADAASALGIVGIHYMNHEQLLKAFNSLNIRI
ncbi:MAG: HAD family phosphatase [Nitrospirae bacterium]|nr:HAD family phosphatase [Nitrospirota bacterium]